MKKNENKATYVAPSIEIIEMENEGVIAASSNGSVPGFGNGGGIGSHSGRSSRSASSSDLEDMINDILTIEN